MSVALRILSMCIGDGGYWEGRRPIFGAVRDVVVDAPTVSSDSRWLWQK
jgi:hypothetical protein